MLLGNWIGSKGVLALSALAVRIPPIQPGQVRNRQHGLRVVLLAVCKRIGQLR